ncbi:MAG: ATP-binding protein [Chlamydiales bacterium]
MSSSDSFIGRKEELQELKAFLKKKTASLIVVKGRRRVGKSRLIEEFAKNNRFYKFTGLAPVDGVTAQDQRNEFARRLREQLGIPEIQSEDWGQLFTFLAKEVKRERVIILLDEISWMASDDKTFLSKLKNVWEDHLNKNSKLILVLCSSVSLWLEENIISSTAFFGRISWTLSLDPLPLVDCNQMLEHLGFKSSPYEKFKILGVTGGIPWYIEQMQGQFTADENIVRHCFTRGGILVDEFDKIFHELFEKRDEIYKRIILSLSTGARSFDEISKETSYPKSGRLTEYLDHLIYSGFVSRDHTWSIKTGKEMNIYLYRLSDNYIRFYLKYIRPKKIQIEARRISKINLSSLVGWESMMGLQFENMVVGNRHELYRLLKIDPNDIIYDNPFFQRTTTRQKGCQIDFLIHTKFKTLYVFEIKFSRNLITRNVIDEVKEKVNRMSIPRGTAVFPVLVHVNGVAEAIYDEEYFYSIIDFSDLL